MKKQFTIFLIFALVKLVAQTDMLDSRFIGWQQSKIVKRMGEPQKIFDDGKGGCVLVYASISLPYHFSGSLPYHSSGQRYGRGDNLHFTSPTFADGKFTTLIKSPKTSWLYTMYFVNSNLLVYRVKTNNLQTPLQQINSLCDIYNSLFDKYNAPINWNKVEVAQLDSLDNPLSLMPIKETTIYLYNKPDTINQIDTEQINYLKKAAARSGGTRIYIDVKHFWETPANPNNYYVVISK
jgi:hypothetical protein